MVAEPAQEDKRKKKYIDWKESNQAVIIGRIECRDDPKEYTDNLLQFVRI